MIFNNEYEELQQEEQEQYIHDLENEIFALKGKL